MSSCNFIIVSLPRCGSTNLANTLGCHPDIHCLIEPFHPSRYGGRFHSAVLNETMLDLVLEEIWGKWNGIKHVWEATGWPFLERPSLNRHLLVHPNLKIIYLMRRNLFRRLVSNFICVHTKYWIGTKREFQVRLSNTSLASLNPDQVRQQIKRDDEAQACHLQYIKENGIPVMPLFYEDLYVMSTSVKQHDLINSILLFLGFPPVTFQSFTKIWRYFFDDATNRWSSREVYKCIPGIELIEQEVGSDSTGWLFKGV